ncbi:LCP family protein [Halalkalibacter sp. APA_J-10(15)]|uniref:LCP family glycopolymer transferase n=1 Tax=Halalkalibacter sp. APA_J-10(15) TaxID=2933805 RepID=UPI001FF3687E|nr:LCP family protein [Halalkalibacter sp. APA_J-10(15)]MCK0470264.1 LCP family protein [Halalkalibacter sp. APA_J-10(15)]
MENRSLNQKNKKKSWIVKSLIIFSIACLAILGATTGYFIHKINNVTAGSQQELIRGEKSELREDAVNPHDDNMSILLLGVDTRPGESNGRTDAILIATLNQEEQSIILTSIPRDSRVEIAGRGTLDKINHAHAFGGIDMTIDTVEQLLDIPIDYFARINFQAFIDVVDAINGVEIEVPFNFEEKDMNNDWIQFTEGMQHLNGEEALAYTRMRKHPQGGGDIGRGQRQQQVLEAIIEKGTSFSSITRFDDVMDAIGENLVTNLSFGDLVSLHSYAGNLNNIEQLQLGGTDLMLDGIYYYEVDNESLLDIRIQLKQHLDIDLTNEEQQHLFMVESIEHNTTEVAEPQQ